MKYLRAYKWFSDENGKVQRTVIFVVKCIKIFFQRCSAPKRCESCGALHLRGNAKMTVLQIFHGSAAFHQKIKLNYRNIPPVFSFLILVFFTACQKKERQVTTAFYHWKTNAGVSDFEKKSLDSLKTKTIYKRIFDVDWNDEAHFPEPISIAQSFKWDNLKIIPTVFITNKTFIQLTDNQLDTFVSVFVRKIIENIVEGSFEEIQVDCDWTQTTRDKFFLFLKKLKKVSQKKLSVTIRLHQVKDKNVMGVPPVDKVMLMVYNMGNLDDAKTQNSILDINTLKLYVANLKNYNLKLDIALPIFSWGVVVRDGEVVKLINGLTNDDFFPSCEPQNFVPLPIKKINTNRFEILENMYVKGFYLYKNDEIRLENTPLSILTETTDILAQNIDNQPLTIAFFYLDSVLLKRYTCGAFDGLVGKFR
jgi:hypothetical protein